MKVRSGSSQLARMSLSDFQALVSYPVTKCSIRASSIPTLRVASPPSKHSRIHGPRPSLLRPNTTSAIRVRTLTHAHASAEGTCLGLGSRDVTRDGLKEHLSPPPPDVPSLRGGLTGLLVKRTPKPTKATPSSMSFSQQGQDCCRG